MKYNFLEIKTYFLFAKLLQSVKFHINVSKIKTQV